MPTIKVSSKGQMVIPSEIRIRHNLTSGDEMEIFDYDKEIVLVPVPKDPFYGAKGLLKFNRPIKEITSSARAEEKAFEKRIGKKVKRGRMA